tara:strand:- start:79 stop:396 length:318 start_codon:yes stop_codon:yes gene_type:complete
MSEPEAIDEEASVSWFDSVGKMRTADKLAGGFFLLGKAGTFITGGFILVSPELFWTSLTITSLLIGASVLLCIAEMTRKHFNVDIKIERLEKELEELKKIKNEEG